MDSEGWGGLTCILCGVFKSKLGFLSDDCGGAPLLADVEEVAGASAAVFAEEVCD